jgi:hypothetical protein
MRLIDTASGNVLDRAIPPVDNQSPPVLPGSGRAISEKNSLTYSCFRLNAFQDLSYDFEGPMTPEAVDIGILVTARSVVDKHGLPINFGPGRGNWLARDFRFMKFEVESQVWGTIE